MLTLPKRINKPRNHGITSLHDVSLSIKELEFILDSFAEFVDIAKLGIGTAYVMPRLKEKISLYQAYGIEVYFGGTLFEKFYSQNKIEAYQKFLDDHSVHWVEISCGTIDIDLETRLRLIDSFKKKYMVVSEVGSKDNDKIMPPSEWNIEIKSMLNAGADYVITEGRSSGTAGIFRPNGEIREGLINDMLMDVDINKLIFEAPTAQSQMYLINKFGANVNLGNIDPHSILQLETQRRGLRSETFYLK